MARASSRKAAANTKTAEAAFNGRTDTQFVMLRLPMPVSVNDIWVPKAGGGVRLSDAYRAWLRDAGWILTLQKPGRINGRYVLTLRLPRASGCDIDNLCKSASDLLELHGVIRNDREAEEVHLLWQDTDDAVLVEIRPFVATEAA